MRYPDKNPKANMTPYHLMAWLPIEKISGLKSQVIVLITIRGPVEAAIKLTQYSGSAMIAEGVRLMQRPLRDYIAVTGVGDAI
jgi:hypothetical protein